MVFVSKHIRYAIPTELADHMAKTWRAGVPYEKPLFVINHITGLVRKVEGDTFAGNLTVRAPSK